MLLAENLKQLRKSAFLSQASFAKELGVSFSTVNRWENGKSYPSYSAMKRIVEFCERNSLKDPFETHNS